MSERPKAVLTLQPDGQIFSGEEVTFTCEIPGHADTEWTYIWYKDGVQLFSYSMSRKYSFSAVESSSGKYTCSGRRKDDSQTSETSNAVTLTVSAKPKPTVSVMSQSSVYTGDRVTLSCNLQSTGWTFLWYKDQHLLSQVAKDTNTLHDTVSNAGVTVYQCKARRGNYDSELSDPVTVTVRERPKAVLTLQPDGQIFSGQEVTFTCEIPGHADTEWTYIWYKDDVQLSSYSVNRKYSFSAVESSSGKYTCSGRRKDDSQTSETSNAVILTVSAKPKPTVSVMSQSSVYTGDRVTLSCNLQSTGWTFLWYKDQPPLFQVVKDTNTLHDTVSNAGVTVYQCKARRGNYDSELSDPVTVTVREIPKPVVSIDPDNQVYRGETVTLRCDIQDEQISYWNYSWNKDGSGVSSEQEYRISSAEMTHTGKCTCRGRERGGSHSSHTSDAVTLTVSEKRKPKITSDLKEAALTGNSVTLTCTLKLQSNGWKFYWIKDTQSTKTETETPSYTIRSVSVSDGGQYRCRAGRGNPVYYTHYSDALWVNVTELPKAVVTIKPENRVFRGERVTLRCEIQGGGDTEWTYSWYKNDYTQNPYRLLQNFSLSSVRNDNGGKYTCRGRRSSDSQSSEISDALTLTVSDPAETVVSVSPLSWLTEGDSVTLSCEVKHSSTGWTFSWYTDVPYRDSQGSLRYRTALLSDSSRGSGGSYTLSPVTLNHTGVYMCRAERGEPVFHTHYSKPQALWITDGDVILESPVHPVTEGNPLTLRCLYHNTNISDSGADFYKDDSVLQKQTTGEMTISSVSKSDEGFYHCTHPERGESPKSWVSVRVSGRRAVVDRMLR
ncbi:cell adhesion molecule CEACAM5-like [Clarias gariepinus]